jgi:signal transduction histidine kinase
VAKAYRRGVVATEPPPLRPGPTWVPSTARVVVVAVAVCAIQLAGSFGAQHRHDGNFRSIDALAVILLVAGPAALLLRRRAPAGALVFVAAVDLVYVAVRNYPDGPVYVSLIVAFFTAVTFGRRRVAIVTLVAGYVTFLWLGWVLGTKDAPTAPAILGVGAWLLVLLAISEVMRVRRSNAIEAWRTREEEGRRQASEERLRIARELHDVLAHNISLINVQAGVALHLMDEQPEQARTALTAIRQASKDALGELRSVLDILRQSGEAPPREPTAGVDDLPRLVASARTAGLDVRTEVAGTRRLVPPGVDLAAYRIVQEALTNVTRHAQATTATVRVSYGDDAVTVEVVDDGRGTSSSTASGTMPQSSAGGGNGIPGMRERAAALGGSLEAGPGPAGRGFAVKAILPLEPDQ